MRMPHIVLLILDSTRSDMLGCYGNADGLTPNIDSLAKNGLVLRNHYAASCGSAASHVSIFTGQHPARHKMFHNLCEIDSNLYPLPRLLRNYGYRSFGHCKMSFVPPVGCMDIFGFDELLSPGNMGKHTESLISIAMNRIRAFTPFYMLLKKLYRRFASPERQIRMSASLQDGRASVEYILDCLKSYGKNSPVFAYSTLLHPHLPTYPPQVFLDRVFRGKRPHRDAFRIQLSVHAFANGDFGLADEAIDSLRKLYMADLMYADYLVGELVSGMSEAGILDKSMVIVTSDHGELLGEHGCINHGAMVWEELFNTPCVIHCPDLLSSTEISRLTSGIDIVPTIFNLMGQESWLREHVQVDGISALADQGGERWLVVDSPPAVLPGRYRRFPNLLKMVNVIRRAVRTEKYKYVWQSDGDHRLCNIIGDKAEKSNIITHKPMVASKLRKKMIAFYRNIDPGFRIDRYPIQISRNVRERITDETVRRELAKQGYG